MVSSGIGCYFSHSDSAGHMIDEDKVDSGKGFDNEYNSDTWPVQLFHTPSSGLLDTNRRHDGINPDTDPVISPEDGINKPGAVHSGFEEGDNVLWFEFGPEFKDDTDLQMLYPNDDERMIATLARDLHVVTVANVQMMLSSSQRFKCLEKCLTYPALAKPDKVTEGISDVLKSLRTILMSLLSTQECLIWTMRPSSTDFLRITRACFSAD